MIEKGDTVGAKGIPACIALVKSCAVAAKLPVIVETIDTVRPFGERGWVASWHYTINACVSHLERYIALTHGMPGREGEAAMEVILALEAWRRALWADHEEARR